MFFERLYEEFDEVYLLFTPVVYSDGLNHIPNYTVANCSTDIAKLVAIKGKDDVIVCYNMDPFDLSEGVIHVAHNPLSDNVIVSTESRDVLGYLNTYSKLDRYNWNVYTFPM